MSRGHSSKTIRKVDNLSDAPKKIKYRVLAIIEILSSFLHAPSKKPGQHEEKAGAVVLLKSASVLGREFSVDALKEISTFPRDSGYNKRIDDAIANLEKADLLEIVD